MSTETDTNIDVETEIEPKITVSDIASFLGLTVQAVHQRMKVNGVKHKTSQNKKYTNHDGAREILSLNLKSKIIAMAVVKGGVGKTTITEAFAVRAALYGLRVLCIDVDQQANLTKGLGMGHKAKSSPIMIDIIEKKADPESAILTVVPGLDIIPSRLDNVTLDGYMMINRLNPSFIFKRIFGKIFDHYDLVVFDCPPTLGSTVCASMMCADLVVAPLNPDVYSYEGIEIMDKEIKNIYEQFNVCVDWRILLNKFDSRTILSTDYISSLLKKPDFSTKLMKSVIRTSQEFPNTKKKNRTIFDSLKAKSSAKEDVDMLTREIIGLMIC